MAPRSLIFLVGKLSKTRVVGVRNEPKSGNRCHRFIVDGTLTQLEDGWESEDGKAKQIEAPDS